MKWWNFLAGGIMWYCLYLATCTHPSDMPRDTALGIIQLDKELRR